MPPDRGADGFTLLEILVAATVLAMVMTLAWGVFRWIQEASARITEGRPRDRAVRVVLDRIERELSGAILVRRRDGVDPLAHPWIFYGEDGALEGQDADRVRFVTQTPLRPAGGGAGRGVRIVSYGLELGDNGLPRLLRSEEDLGDQLEKAIDLSEAQVVAENVATFSLRYAGENGVRDDWDSTSVELDDQLPQSVEVTVQLWQRDAQGERVAGTPVLRVMEIPTRPEFLEPPGGGFGKCETGGISTAECQRLWIEALQASDRVPDQLRTSLTALFARVSDSCWEPEDASPELSDLKKQLASAQQMTGVQVQDCPPGI